MIFYDTELCVECGTTYYVIHGDTHGIPIKPTQDINEPKQNVYIPKISILNNNEYCPKCGIKLQQGKEILDQLINREKCWKFDLPPLKSKEKALMCPICKKDYLYYNKFWLAD
ncbi:MAG: hypothetical protein EU547_05090 [Promethearchaeota archaeon]|nr:MAG: hypothetical protein EU547_05090 [Candidatus Lokiarchaeota archaeon]